MNNMTKVESVTELVHYRTPKGTMLHEMADLTQVYATAREFRVTCPLCLAVIGE